MIRFFTAGESHGPVLTAIIEGLPAGIPIDADKIDYQLHRRQKGAGAGPRMALEHDRVQITAGVAAGVSTGAPIAMLLPNRDFANWRRRKIAPCTIPRPGHADLTGAVKYGYRDLRLALERASARETAMRVAVGAICRMLLSEFAIGIGGYVVRIGAAEIAIPDALSWSERMKTAESNELRCPLASDVDSLRREIDRARENQDSVGGIIEIVTLNLPPGLGSYVHYERRLDARLAMAIISIPAIKGVEFGRAFSNAALPGSKVHDSISIDPGGELRRSSNRAGGIEGGIANGEPLIIRAAMKPIATLLAGIPSVDLASGDARTTPYERSDICAVVRTVPVAEAMIAVVLVDALLEKLGGDSLAEIRPRFEKLRHCRLADLKMDAREWQFDYRWP